METTVTFSGVVVVSVAARFAEFPAPDGFRICARHPRRFEKAVRVQPHVQLPSLGIVGRRRNRLIPRAVDMPRVFAVDEKCLVRMLLERRSAFPTRTVFPRCRVQSRLTIELLLHGFGFPVHGARVVGQRLRRAANPHSIRRRCWPTMPA